MPTGYTAELSEKGQSFNDFVLTCARAFGACVHQRDDPLSVRPRPEKKSFDGYHTTHLNDALAALADVKTWTEDKKISYGEEQKFTEIESYTRYLVETKKKRQRYEAMIDEVSRWKPPSEDHIGLKKFMLEQLNTGMNGDCSESYYIEALEKAEKQTPMEYFDAYMRQLERDVEYHRKESEKEAQRDTGRSQWIEQLYESLGEELPE